MALRPRAEVEPCARLLRFRDGIVSSVARGTCEEDRGPSWHGRLVERELFTGGAGLTPLPCLPRPGLRRNDRCGRGASLDRCTWWPRPRRRLTCSSTAVPSMSGRRRHAAAAVARTRSRRRRIPRIVPFTRSGPSEASRCGERRVSPSRRSSTSNSPASAPCGRSGTVRRGSVEGTARRERPSVGRRGATKPSPDLRPSYFFGRDMPSVRMFLSALPSPDIVNAMRVTSSSSTA